MKNKILIRVIVPYVQEEYEIFIPVNERISKVKKLIINTLMDITENAINKEKKYCLIDSDGGGMYQGNQIVRDTNIINAKSVILF